MRTSWIALMLCALLLAGGCARETTTTEATTGEAVTRADLSPEELGELGAQIEKNPGEAERLLSEKGLNEESFEQAIRKVSEDPEASKRYSEAYKKARA